MKISKIKFLGGSGIGNRGIKIFYEDAVQKEKGTVIDNIERERLVPINFMLRGKVNKIKPYFLMLTGHWRQEWETLLTEGNVDASKVSEGGYTGLVSLLDNTVITNIIKSGQGFVFSGNIRVLGNKVVNITTPIVCDEDGFEFLDQISELCNEISDSVIEMLKQEKLFAAGEAKQMLLDLYSAEQKDDDYNRVLEQDEEMSDDEMIFRLTKKGHVVYEPLENIEIGEKAEEEKKEEEEIPLVEAEEVVELKKGKGKKKEDTTVL
jgi:hypothetical protein